MTPRANSRPPLPPAARRRTPPTISRIPPIRTETTARAGRRSSGPATGCSTTGRTAKASHEHQEDRESSDRFHERRPRCAISEAALFFWVGRVGSRGTERHGGRSLQVGDADCREWAPSRSASVPSRCGGLASGTRRNQRGRVVFFKPEPSLHDVGPARSPSHHDSIQTRFPAEIIAN
jgi:hypothetical protein